MSQAKKRRREEETPQEAPLIQFQLDKGHAFYLVLDLLEQGNVRLYCSELGIRLCAQALGQGVLFLIHCPFRTLGTNPVTCQISVDRDTLIHVLGELKLMQASHMELAIFSDRLHLKVLDEGGVLLKSGRVSANFDEEIPYKEDPGADFDYVDVLSLPASVIESRLPKGNELLFTMESHRLCISARDINSGVQGYLPLKNAQSGYQELFGELCVKLLRKLLSSLGHQPICLRFGDSLPLNLKGQWPGGESWNIYMVGIEPDD